MNELGAAARRTLEEQSARFTETIFWHPPLESGLTGSYGQGLVDFRQRRAYVRRDGVAGNVLKLILERFPWIAPDDDDDDEDDSPVEHIYADGEHFWRVGGGWRRDDDADARSTSDPIGLIERLTDCDEVHPRDGCFGFLIANGRSRLYGDSWLDEEGRIARVTFRSWSPTRRKRKPPSELWTTLELMDFGRPVRIEIPAVEEKPEPDFDPWGCVLDVGRVARGAWHVFRRWRAYTRA